MAPHNRTSAREALLARQVRIVGEPDVYEVLCETASTIVLINPAAKLRQQITELEARLTELRAQLANRAHAAVVTEP